VRADRVSCDGAIPGVTPHLDALAATGVRFANAISESTWTLPVAFTLFTGLTPREHQAERTRMLPPHMPSLPELLWQAGYATFGATNNSWLTDRSGLARGFDSFYYPPQESRVTARFVSNVMQPLGWMKSAGGAMVERFEHWLRRTSDPWFAALWFNDAHHPYMAPRPFIRRFQPRPLSRRRLLEIARRMRRPRSLAPVATADDLADLRGLCSAATAYVDSFVGRIAEQLARGGQAEQTLIAVVADHGDMLGEHGLLGHGPAAGIHQPLIHVPLLLRGPGFTGGTVSEALVQLADVTATLAAAAGVADRLPSTAAERLDLVGATAGTGRKAAICEREPLTPKRLARERAAAPGFDFAPHDCHLAAVLADGFKLIARDPGADELYYLPDDPDEQHDLIGQHPRQAEALRAALANLHGRALPHASTEGLSLDDAETMDRRLQDLGYL
jgi:uncharacterized sulfatase